ncbi:hypothetical protein KI387_016193, partial [Taxus chinensis]
ENPSKPKKWHTIQHLDIKLLAPLAHCSACQQQVISALGTPFSMSTASYQRPWRTVQHVDNKLSAPLAHRSAHVDSKLSAPLAHRSACRQQVISALGTPFSMSTA